MTKVFIFRAPTVQPPRLGVFNSGDICTPTILNEFISRIEVQAPTKVDGKRHQDIDIFYNAVGIIDLPTEEELYAMEEEYQAMLREQEQAEQTQALPSQAQHSQARRLPKSA